MKLANKKSTDGVGDSPLKALRARELLKDLGQGWSLNARGHLERRYTFQDFAQALAFTNKVGAVAEAEGHHHDLYLTWGKCKLEIWSHKMKGLTERDFILAAKADRSLHRFGYRHSRQESWPVGEEVLRLGSPPALWIPRDPAESRLLQRGVAR